MNAPASLVQKVRKIEASLAGIAAKLADEIARGADRDAEYLKKLTTDMSTAKLDLGLMLAKTPMHGLPEHTHGRLAADSDAALLVGAKRRLMKWSQMLALVNRQIAHQPQPLSAQSQLPPEANVLLQNVYSALHKLANPMAQSDEAFDNDCFADIPLNPWQFDQLMRNAHRICLAKDREHPARFIDVGCGGATKLLLAMHYFVQADGLEFDAGYVKAARQTLRRLGRHQHKVHHADASRFDGYGAYDVVYFYRPIKDPELLVRMEDRIMDQVKKGTVLIAPYPQFEGDTRREDCRELCDQVYIMGLSDDEIVDLHRRISATGPDVIAPGQTVSDTLGYWAPVLDVSRRCGFDLS